MASTTDFSEASLNTLQLALRTMKERCRGQEARIGELEDDNAHLRADRSVGSISAHLKQSSPS